MRTFRALFLFGLLSAGPLVAEDQTPLPPTPPGESKPKDRALPQSTPSPSRQKPVSGFTPSEKIKADQSVAFPVDI